MIRDTLKNDALDDALEEIAAKVVFRIKQKGNGAYAGPHEAFGIIDEEHDEPRDAMRANDPVQFHKELIDIAVACIIAMASQLPEDTGGKAV